MTWVKICGTTNLEDARLAVDAGADALGFVFHDQSPRRVDVESTRHIVAQLPEHVDKVGVFVHQGEDTICDAVDRAGLTAVQLHGNDRNPHVADRLAALRPKLKILAVVSMRHPGPEGWAMTWSCGLVHAFLLDSGTSSKPGGTGEAFDWKASAATVDAIRRLGRVIIAGGLKPSNVAVALELFHPWGVDVVSGVESVPGKKDPEKVRAFVQAVRGAAKSAESL